MGQFNTNVLCAVRDIFSFSNLTQPHARLGSWSSLMDDRQGPLSANSRLPVPLTAAPRLVDGEQESSGFSQEDV